MTETATPPVIGVIGGSGVYEIDGLTNTRWERVSSPFGEASDELLFGELDGQQMVFLPRHGRGHRIPPSELNYRANIDVLKRAGVTEILSISACGSLKAELPPGHFVIVDQFIDRTFARAKSFFGTGLVAHVGLGHPVCGRLGDAVEEAIDAARTEVTRATRLPIHKKTLVIVSDDQHRIAWAAASDGWETDYRSGSPPEMG